MPTFTAEVDVDLEDVVEDLTDDEIVAELERVLRRRQSKRTVTVPNGLGDGDPSASRYIEAAFLAAKRMADVPRELADLFWHVHGRAL